MQPQPNARGMAVLAFLAGWTGTDRPPLRDIVTGTDAGVYDTSNASYHIARLARLGYVDPATRRPTDAGRALLATATEPAEAVPA